MNVTWTRRGFLLTGAAAGGALLVGVGTTGTASDAQQIGSYVRVAPDNRVTIGTTTSEIGQGTNTSIAMLIAEELDVDFNGILVEAIAPRFTAEGEQEDGAFASGAGGSTAIWESYVGARQAGAAARFMLIAAAAELWRVSPDALTTAKGYVHHRPTSRSATYGSLASAAAGKEPPAGPLPLKPRAQHSLIGRPQKQLEAKRIVVGAPLYGIDQRMDGMLHAVVVRSRYLGGTIRRLNDAKIRGLPGIRHIVRMPGPGPSDVFRGQDTHYLGEGVAIIADKHWQALKARDSLDIEWAPGPSRESSDTAYAAAWDALEYGGRQLIRRVGNVEAAFDAAAKVVEARYEAPLVAHATMEPQNCIAHVDGGRVRLIAPTQKPGDAVLVAAAVAGVAPANVEITPVRSGGGFGRRLYQDPIAEAVFLSKAVGRPVKLVWTRECDMGFDLYRPGGAHLLRAAIDKDGRLTGWEHRVASQSRLYRTSREPVERHWTTELFPDDHPGSLAVNQRYEYVPMQSSAIRGAWRAPGHTVNAWVQQAFLDEVAAAAGRDPLDYRLALLGEPRDLKYDGHGGPLFSTERLANVLKLAAEKAGWQGPAAGDGKGRGIAGHFSFGSYIAHVVDVSMKDDGGFSVDRVVSGIDCGIAVNPNGVAMQNEGAINDALSTALGQAITIKDGRVEQANFDAYEMMRIDRSAGRIETHIVPSDAPPRGMGEPSMPPFTPALTNAIAAASGKRIRKLPIGSQLA